MSEVVGHARVLVHHGGIGTTYAGLQAGVPTAIVPQAFDQSFNGRLLEAAGLGRLVRPQDDLAGLLSSLVDDGGLHERTKNLAAALVTPQDAARGIADRLTKVVADEGARVRAGS
jgi:UDP:flavonoid glycosyltransferase YjiC (YdhE family)